MRFERIRSYLKTNIILCGILLLLPNMALAGNRPAYTIVIKNHQFDPAELTVPAGKKIKLVIDNQDPTPEEFESYDLNREKIVTGNGTISVFIGPLKPGEYKYFGEFHQDTAQGIIKAVDNINQEEK